MGLKLIWDSLAHLEVLEGSSKRDPNKQGLENTLQGTCTGQHDGLSVSVIGVGTLCLLDDKG